MEVPGLAGRQPYTVPRGRLGEIVHLRVAEILNLLGKEVQRARFVNPLHSGAVLTGGTALVEGLPELASEVFGMHTRIGYPMGVSGLIDVIHDPAYACGVGLVLYGYRTQKKAQVGGGRSARWRGQRGLWGMLKRWFKEVV
jgi:cell division protein FtsA